MTAISVHNGGKVKNVWDVKYLLFLYALKRGERCAQGSGVEN
jgi:hypothetical protein